jgi:hypothetical protein
MKPANYKCLGCGKIYEHWIGDLEDFPRTILSECGNSAHRIYSPLASICHQGKCGNEKNGYTSNSVSIKKT